MVERRSVHARKRVFIVDDHPLVREWLTNVINQQWDLTVCGESKGGGSCSEAIEKKRPHVAIVDLSLKDCSGFDLIGEIKRRAPQVQIMVLSMHSSPLYARRAFRAGATGYVVKTESTRQICKAIRDVLNGVPFVSEEIGAFSDSRTTEDNFDLTLLSEREIEIFRFLGRGNSTRKIAHILGISIKIIGAVAGVLVVASVFFVERVLKLDDPVGAISVHGTCGSWGVLSVGILANGSYGQGWGGVHKLIKDGAMQIITNDGAKETIDKFNKLLTDGWTDQGVTGGLGTLFGAAYSDWSQLGAEVVGTLTNLVFVALFAVLWFKVSNLIIPLRSKREDEIAGLDIPEMGAEAYPDNQLTDKSSPPA